jgi:hypothetical protein
LRFRPIKETTRMSRISQRTLLLILLGVVLVSCNAITWMNDPGSARGSGGGLKGKPAPPAEGEDADGHPLSVADFRGRVVMLSFWASY